MEPSERPRHLGIFSPHSIPARIFWTTFGVGLIAIGSVVVLILWLTSSTDKLAKTNALKQIDAFITSQQQRLEVLTVDYAHWDQAYQWYVEENGDLLYEGLGSGAAESEAFDLLFLIEPDGRASYAYASGIYQSDLAVFDTDLAAPFVEQIADMSVSSYDVLHGVARYNQSYVFVAATRLRPDDTVGLTGADLPVLIGASVIDDAMIQALLAQLLLPDLYLEAPDVAVPAGSLAVVLTSVNAQPVAQIQFVPPKPGQEMVYQVLPIVSGLLVLMLLGSWIAAKASRKQTIDYIDVLEAARTDALTGVLNRTGLNDLIKSPSLQEELKSAQVALLYLDLNDFKLLNDTSGHDAGDAALQVTARRLRAAIRGSDHVIRLGGDEFLCIIRGPNPENSVQQVALRIKQLIAEPAQFLDMELKIDVSMGIAVAGADHRWDNLLSQADAAMYYAKRRRLDTAVTFSESLTAAQ